MKKPQTPEEQLQRILRIAKMNGMSFVIIAGLSLLFSIGDWFDTAVCLGIVYGGFMELSGRKRLEAGDATGIRRMVKAELLVLVVVVIYCVVHLSRGMGPELKEIIGALDMPDAAPAFRMAFIAQYIGFGLITIVYQGGMARYYWRRAGVVREAIAARMRPPVPPRMGATVDPEDLVT